MKKENSSKDVKSQNLWEQVVAFLRKLCGMIESAARAVVAFVADVLRFIFELLKAAGEFLKAIAWTAVAVALTVFLLIVAIYLTFSALGIKDSPSFQAYRETVLQKLWDEQDLSPTPDTELVPDVTGEEVN